MEQQPLLHELVINDSIFSARYATPPHPSRRPTFEFPPPPSHPPEREGDRGFGMFRDAVRAPLSGRATRQCWAQEEEMLLEMLCSGKEDRILEDEGYVPDLLAAPAPGYYPEEHEYSYAYDSSLPPAVMLQERQKYHHRRQCHRQVDPRHSRHTYISTYGVEENIYEEINEVQNAFRNPDDFADGIEDFPCPPHLSRPGSRQRSGDGVIEEVRKVQSCHKKVLGELNLAVEAMLMPSRPLEDLDLPVGPTDELLTPDSGFQSGSGYVGTRAPDTPRSSKSFPRTGGPPPALDGHQRLHKCESLDMKQLPPPSSYRRRSLRHELEKNLGFFNKKGWRFPGFGGRKDEPRLRSGSWDGSQLYEGLNNSSNKDHGFLSRRLDVHRQVSSEDSWGSAESDLSSGDESEKSGGSSSKSNGNLKSTLNKAKTLCDKWRESRTKPKDAKDVNENTEGRLSRWFSIRRNQYDVDRLSERPKNKMPQLPEEEETFVNYTFHRRQQPPTLPPPPPGLTTEQIKRRHIVAAIVHSENSYVATLQRLVNDYKKPLEESSPPILSSSKISTLFHRVPEILQCHTLFRIALAECVRNWDKEEKIGDVFAASFSKAIVLEIYSDFINNFSIAMDLAKQESKRKSALADFLKVKQITAHDRLSFFGLMVKPVQRFPQFILLLQDLLKHTPHGHHDRMSLQLALTQLESLAEMLNERKREAEQFQAFREMLRHVSGKFSVRPLCDGNRYLLREDNVTQLEFNQSGLITKSKSRRLLLLNDLLVCVSVAPKPVDDFCTSERLTLKWSHPVTDVEVQDTSASPTLSRLLTAGLNKSSSLKSDKSSDSSSGVDNLCQEMNDLMHDYEVVSRISDLISTLKGSYEGINLESTRKVLNSIQTSIQQKDEEIAWVDSCCLQFVVKTKSGKEEQFTFQTDNPIIKKEWTTELRLAQLALDPNNSPAWDIPEQERRPSTKMPLFAKALPVYKSQHQTEVRCGCFYTVTSMKPTRRARQQNYLWVCTTDGVSSHIAILSQQQARLKDIGAFDMVETKVTAMEFVKGSSPGTGLKGETVWMGTDSRKLIIYAAQDPEKQEEVASCALPAVVVQIRYHCDQVFFALSNGTVLLFRRQPEGEWNLKDPQTLLLGTDPVSCLLPINVCMYAACGKKVWVMNALTGDMQKNFSVQHEHVGNVNLMAHSGIGLWISLKNSSTVCLYHTETFKHLQDINIASNVLKILSNKDYVRATRSICVTALMACKGLLWVGTNVGITLTIPLPRLEGVPIISGRVNISYHAHFGPITFLLALQPRTSIPVEMSNSKRDSTIQEESESESQQKSKLEKQLSDGSLIPNSVPKLKHQLSSPVVLRRRTKENGLRRASKTLPRGLGMFSVHGSQDCDVYGLYGELMRDYEDDHPLNDPMYESIRRSDPELVPNKVSTLDRRVRLKASRPRSLDLSNWSVDSRSSTYTSSGSEESVPITLPSNAKQNTSADSREVNTAQSNSPKVVEAPRTVITIMGGRGYINLRKACIERNEKGRSGSVLLTETNSNDAHVVIWEMKL